MTTPQPIRSLFARDISRRIEEVIKVDQDADEILRDEIDEYVVTDRGIALWPTLRSLGRWGREHLGEAQLRYFRHATCGTELGSYGECAVCGTVVPVPDVEMVPGPGLDPDPADPVSRVLLRPRRLLEPIDIGHA